VSWPQQATSTDWRRRRLDASIDPAFSVETFRTAAAALKAADGYDLLVIHGPARTSAATLDIAKAAVLAVHELVREGIPAEPLAFALCKVGTDAEETDARTYITEAGYAALPGAIPERPAYRQAQNVGHTITEMRYPAPNKKAEEVLQAIAIRVG
jgi:chromosome partitioning protein